jgi:hypothetical protein
MLVAVLVHKYFMVLLFTRESYFELFNLLSSSCNENKTHVHVFVCEFV